MPRNKSQEGGRDAAARKKITERNDQGRERTTGKRDDEFMAKRDEVDDEEDVCCALSAPPACA